MNNNLYENFIVELLLDNSCNIITKSSHKYNDNQIVVIDNNKKQFNVSQNDLLDTIMHVRNLLKSYRFIKDKDKDV